MIATAARLRCHASWDVETTSTAIVLRSLARRSQAMTEEAADHERQILAIVRSWRPDLLELTRGRVAALEADLEAVLHVRAKLSGGYHRDFQLLKEPLMRGLDRAEAILAVTAEAVPRLGVNRERCAAAMAGGPLTTDEVMRRVEAGRPFRSAYREVAGAIRAGESFAAPSPSQLVARRRSTGGIGDLGLSQAAARVRRARRWGRGENARFDAAMRRLAGGRRKS